MKILSDYEREVLDSIIDEDVPCPVTMTAFISWSKGRNRKRRSAVEVRLVTTGFKFYLWHRAPWDEWADAYYGAEIDGVGSWGYSTRKHSPSEWLKTLVQRRMRR